VRLRERLGRNVRRLRGRGGWSQEDVAAVAGISVRQLSTIEAGLANATLTTVESLAGAMGVEPGVLLRVPRGG
jgi:transcriptional regulator with XRE-family HTH domain